MATPWDSFRLVVVGVQRVARRTEERYCGRHLPSASVRRGEPQPPTKLSPFNDSGRNFFEL